MAPLYSLAFYEALYDLLVKHAGARESARADFLWYWSKSTTCSEWRFQGSLGSGGKLYRGGQGHYVSCYPEDETLERTKLITRLNAEIDVLEAARPV